MGPRIRIKHGRALQIDDIQCAIVTGPTDRRQQKRQLRRARRRQEKTDPENAATTYRQLTRGWTT